MLDESVIHRTIGGAIIRLGDYLWATPINPDANLVLLFDGRSLYGEVTKIEPKRVSLENGGWFDIAVWEFRSMPRFTAETVHALLDVNLVGVQVGDYVRLTCESARTGTWFKGYVTKLDLTYIYLDGEPFNLATWTVEKIEFPASPAPPLPQGSDWLPDPITGEPRWQIRPYDKNWLDIVGWYMSDDGDVVITTEPQAYQWLNAKTWQYRPYPEYVAPEPEPVRRIEGYALRGPEGNLTNICSLGQLQQGTIATGYKPVQILAYDLSVVEPAQATLPQRPTCV